MADDWWYDSWYSYDMADNWWYDSWYYFATYSEPAWYYGDDNDIAYCHSENLYIWNPNFWGSNEMTWYFAGICSVEPIWSDSWYTWA
jgi:hypothetical protein